MQAQAPTVQGEPRGGAAARAGLALSIEQAAHCAWEALMSDPALQAQECFDDDGSSSLQLCVSGERVDLRYDRRSLAVCFSVDLGAGAIGPAPARMVELEGSGLHAMVRLGADPSSRRHAAFFHVTVFLLAHNARLCRDAASRLVHLVRELRHR
jgi:hypothetical protein